LSMVLAKICLYQGVDLQYLDGLVVCCT